VQWEGNRNSKNTFRERETVTETFLSPGYPLVPTRTDSFSLKSRKLYGSTAVMRDPICTETSPEKIFCPEMDQNFFTIARTCNAFSQPDYFVSDISGNPRPKQFGMNKFKAFSSVFPISLKVII